MLPLRLAETSTRTTLTSSRIPTPSPRPNAQGPLPLPRGRDSYFALQRLVSIEDLSVVFQPIVTLDGGALFAYEALVRCRRPELSSPPVLFERAVSAGCVGRLGRMIREIAIPLATRRPIFLNVHPLELQEGWLVRPDDPIYLHDHSVYLEITESVPLTHYELCIDVLKDVRARSGSHLVVDDLGAGYSNLKRIADLEPKVVKLDRGLVCGIDRSARQQQLVSSVVRLCMDLDAAVVAEGIETEAELSALKDTGAHYGQGYLFARPAYPMPAVSWPPEAPRTSAINLVPAARNSLAGASRAPIATRSMAPVPPPPRVPEPPREGVTSPPELELELDLDELLRNAEAG